MAKYNWKITNCNVCNQLSKVRICYNELLCQSCISKLFHKIVKRSQSEFKYTEDYEIYQIQCIKELRQLIPLKPISID